MHLELDIYLVNPHFVLILTTVVSIIFLSFSYFCRILVVLPTTVDNFSLIPLQTKLPGQNEIKTLKHYEYPEIIEEHV
jgi:hypothetical protein